MKIRHFALVLLISLVATSALSGALKYEEKGLNGGEVFLLKSPHVQTNLKLSANQSAVVNRCNRLLDWTYLDFDRAVAGKYGASRRTIALYRDRIAHYELLRYVSLSEAQVARLRQLALQRAGVFGLLSQDFVRQAKLSHSQHRLINRIAGDAHMAKLRSTELHVRSNGLIGDQPLLLASTSLQAALDRIEKNRGREYEIIRKRYLQRGLAALTPQQSYIYYRMVGTPYDFLLLD